MKIKLLFFLSLSFSLNNFCFSQAWAPIGAIWHYTEYYFSSPAVGYHKIESIADTLVNGKLCKILQKSSGLCDARGANEYMYEDSGRVFFYDTDRNVFQMLFSSNANPGNSWVIYPSSSTTDSITVTVDSTSATIINGIPLKVIYVSYSNYTFNWVPYTYANTFIERIGNTVYMFPWTFGGCDAVWAGPVRCYSDSIIGFADFDATHACNYTTVGINEPNVETLFLVSPNPASDFIHIQNRFDSPLLISIFSSYGTVVRQVTLAKEAAVKIDLSDLSAGMYLVTALSDKNLISRKIIKQ